MTCLITWKQDSSPAFVQLAPGRNTVCTYRLGERERTEEIQILNVVHTSGFLSLKPGPRVSERWWSGAYTSAAGLNKPVSCHQPKLAEWLMLLGPGLGATALQESHHWETPGCSNWGWPGDFSGLFLNVLPFLSRYSTWKPAIPWTSEPLNRQNKLLGTSKRGTRKVKGLWHKSWLFHSQVIKTSGSLCPVACTEVTVILIP